MARASAIPAVAAAVLEALNVATVRALCGGGHVSRNRHREDGPPYVSIGPCAEGPDDALGVHYGAVVEVPIHITTSGADADGDERGAQIANAIMAILDEPTTLTVPGWTLRMQEWVGTRGEVMQFQDGAVGYNTTVTFHFHVRAA